MEQHDHDLSSGHLTEHEFDGIREYDNPTPGWWHLIMFGSILFSILYVIFFTGELGWTPQGQLKRAEARYFEQLFGKLGELQPTQDTILKLMQDPKWVTVGGTIFAANCAQCHRADGGGLNGPNMTDDSYIHVKTLTDIYATIANGVVAKGMPSWSNRLNQNQRIMAAVYVASLRGTTPGPGAKGAEPNAVKIPAWPEPPKETSTAGVVP